MSITWTLLRGEYHMALDAEMDWVGALAVWNKVGQKACSKNPSELEEFNGLLGMLLSGPFDKFLHQWKKLNVTRVFVSFPEAAPLAIRIAAWLGAGASAERYVILENRNGLMGLDDDGNPNLKSIGPGVTETMLPEPQSQPVPPPVVVGEAEVRTLTTEAIAQFKAGGSSVTAALERWRRALAKASVNAAADRTAAALEQLVRVGATARKS